MVTVAVEGGQYSARKDEAAPIRIYSDRWIEDDIFASMMGRSKRERLSKKDYRRVRNLAKASA